VLDIDKFRDQIINMHGLSGADGDYTFYHDETNNTKKLRINAQGFNVAELTVFVLGGIVHEGAPRALDIGALRRAMRIQASAKEIKLTHVAKGSFLEILQAKRLTTFLRWIAESGLTIHYRSLDPLYWSIVDIIDSILARLPNPMLIAHHELLKGDLMLILRADLQLTIDLFRRYKYPSLDAAARRPFLDELLGLLERNGALLPDFNVMMLKGTLQAGRQLDDLVFIENNEPHELIDNFSMFYVTRILAHLERDDLGASTKCKADLLLRPDACTETDRMDRDKAIHSSERSLNLILPFERRTDVFMRHES
jgi:hypothetical protein